MPKYKLTPAERAAIAAAIVPPKNPYEGYDQRQAELGEKDHPWAQPVREADTEAEPVAEIEVDEATLARDAAHNYYHKEFRLTGPYDRSEVERASQQEIDARGRAAAEAALAESRARRGQS